MEKDLCSAARGTCERLMETLYYYIAGDKPDQERVGERDPLVFNNKNNAAPTTTTTTTINMDREMAEEIIELALRPGSSSKEEEEEEEQTSRRAGGDLWKQKKAVNSQSVTSESLQHI